MTASDLSSDFRHRQTAVWAPAGAMVLTALLLVLAVTADSVLQTLFLLATSSLTLWVATLFYEEVDLHLDTTTQEVVLSRWLFARFKPCQESRVYPLDDLNAVWLEPLAAGGNGPTHRVSLRFGSDWVPVTRTFSNTKAPVVLQQDLARWLSAQGLSVKTGKGPLPT